MGVNGVVGFDVVGFLGRASPAELGSARLTSLLFNYPNLPHNGATFPLVSVAHRRGLVAVVTMI